MAQLTFGERIHILRRRLGSLTQPALAKAVGVSAGTIFRVEKGDFSDFEGADDCPLSADVACRAADHLLGLTDDDREWTPDVDDEDAHVA